MALTEYEQIRDILNRSNHILITFPNRQDGDAIATALALYLMLQKKNKRVDIVSTDFTLPGTFRFLPQAKVINNQINSLRKFIVSVDISQNQLNNVSYSVDKDKLNIYLTPKQGSFNIRQVTTRSSDFLYDLIITLNTPDLNSLGELYLQNTDFFFNTNIINFDHNPANEQYGQINLVNFNASSTAEIIFEIIQKIDSTLLDNDIATCLFTGLTAATKSFSSPKVTPTSLGAAAQLINLGARREEVVTHLYRTKQLNTLKLWGRVLARLKNDPQRKLVWSLLQPDDFVKAGAGSQDLPSVIEELLINSPEAGTVILLYEMTPNKTEIFLYGGSGHYALDLLKPFNPQGDRHRATAFINETVVTAEKKIIEHIKSVLKPLES
ncbi:hypothetical protein KKC17_01365 [Patescibacteria group bacterium]|nr:hypothetical protein [Patescibacteria group bacterium]